MNSLKLEDMVRSLNKLAEQYKTKNNPQTLDLYIPDSLEKNKSIRPIAYDTYQDISGECNITNIFDITRSYYHNVGSSNINNITELQYRRMQLSNIFEQRVIFIITNTFNNSLITVMNKIKNYDYRDKMCNLSLPMFIGGFIDTIKDKHRYFINIDEYLPGGIFNNYNCIIDAIMAISSELYNYINHGYDTHLGYDYEEENKDFIISIKNTLKAGIVLEFCKQLGLEMKKLIDEFENVYYSAGRNDNIEIEYAQRIKE